MLIKLNKVFGESEQVTPQDIFRSFTEERLWETWMEEVKFNLLTTMDEVEDYFEMALASSNEIAIDLETTGLNVKEDKIVGLSFSYEDNECAYIPVLHHKGRNVPLNKIISFLESIKDKVKWIFYNAKFDTEFLYFNGLEMISGVHFEDAMLSVCLHDLNRARSHAGLKAASKLYLNKKMIPFTDAVGTGDKETGESFRSVPLDIATIYAGSDALLTRELYNYFAQVRIDQSFIYNMETQLIDVVRRIERNGVAIDIPYFQVLHDRINSRIERLRKQIFEGCGKQIDEFNLDSGPQVGKVFFEEMGIPNPYKTASGKYNTSSDVLMKLAEETGHEVLVLYRDYKKAQKLMSSFVLPYLHDKDLKIGHLAFKQFQISTGRFGGGGGSVESHYLPGVNPQNIPSIKPKKGVKIKKITNSEVTDSHLRYEYLLDTPDGLHCTAPTCDGCAFFAECKNEQLTDAEMDINHNIRRGYIARDPKKLLFTIDFSGVELRMAANLSGEAKWVDSFVNGDGDLHTLSAIGIYNKPAEQISKSERGMGKTVNFLSLFGGGAHKLAENAGIPVEEAQRVLTNFWNSVPAVDALRQKVWADAERNKYAVSAFGRRRPSPAFLEDVSKAKTKEERNDIRKRQSAAQREAFSVQIQGSAADLMKLAMLRCDRKIEEKGWRDKLLILLTVHDELVFECDRDIANEAMREMSKCMQVPITGWPVPFITDIELSDNALSNWGMTVECRIHTDGNIYSTKVLKMADKKEMDVRDYLVSIGETPPPIVKETVEDEGEALEDLVKPVKAEELEPSKESIKEVSKGSSSVLDGKYFSTEEEFTTFVKENSYIVDLTKEEGSEIVKLAKAFVDHLYERGKIPQIDKTLVKEHAMRFIGERAVEKLLGISFLEKSFNSDLEGLPNIGYDFDISLNELGSFPKAFEKTSIVAYREGTSKVYILGLCKPHVLAMLPRLPEEGEEAIMQSEALFGVENLLPFKDMDEFKVVAKSYLIAPNNIVHPCIEGVYSASVTDSTQTKVKVDTTDNIEEYLFDFRDQPLTQRLANRLNSLLDSCRGIGDVYLDFSNSTRTLIFKRNYVNVKEFRKQYTIFFD